jgi:peptide/nickel transport system ATP-binding protein/oligopeptide transport system ATP-binding protein
MTGEPLLTLADLRVAFATPEGPAPVVDGIDLAISSGEVIGLVGESGSGKSVTLRAILRLLGPAARVTGRIQWQGSDLLALPEPELRRVRGREIAMIFQEPMAALNPVLPVGIQIEESLETHLGLHGGAARSRAAELLTMVGIGDAARRLGAFPHEFSGGMRQRVMIAIALAAGPKLLLADEPTTALDVTIQDQILKLLLRLRRELGMSIVLVTHDLAVVAQACTRVAVLYAGRIMEVGPVAEVLRRPAHAYTQGLLGAVPSAHRPREPLANISGAPPRLSDLPPGCRFAPRCALAEPKCLTGRPAPVGLGPERASACLRHELVMAQADART